MRVRPIAVDDVEGLARGMRTVVEEERWLGLQPPVSVAEMAARIGEQMVEGRLLLVLEDEAADPPAPVGLIDLHETRTKGVLAIGMWILPGHRGRGGGRMLLQAAIDARPPSTHKIELEVWPDNAPAIGLYERLGFEREGLRRDHYRRKDGRLRSSLIMARLFPDAVAPDRAA